MPEDKKKYTRKDKKEDKKQAKLETGMYAKDSKRAKRRAEKEGFSKPTYHETATGAAIKDFGFNLVKKLGLTKKRSRLGKVGGASRLDPKKGSTDFPRLRKPELQEPSTKTRSFRSDPNPNVKSEKDVQVVEDKSKMTTQKASTPEELRKRTDESTDKGGMSRMREEYKKMPEFKKNEAKKAEYEKKRLERRAKKESEEYDPGSRTRESKAAQEKVRGSFSKEGGRSAYRRVKKELKEDRMKKRN